MKVFLFPGQGSQEIGMGADLFKTAPVFRDLIRLASELTGADLERLCLRGPERELVRTEYLQPLIVAVSIGYARRLSGLGIEGDVVLGHSLGELSALCAAGVIDPPDAIRLAVERGRLMGAAAGICPGGMLAVLNSSPEQIESVIAASRNGDSLCLANDNAPGQVILSGSIEALARVARALDNGGARCKRLPVAGPWHSSAMADAARQLAGILDTVRFNPPRARLIMNVTGDFEHDPSALKSLLVRALTSGVQWRRSMSKIVAAGPEILFEVGPGRVLSCLARANGVGGHVRILNVNNHRGLLLAAVWKSGKTQEPATRWPGIISSSHPELPPCNMAQRRRSPRA